MATWEWCQSNERPLQCAADHVDHAPESERGVVIGWIGKVPKSRDTNPGDSDGLARAKATVRGARREPISNELQRLLDDLDQTADSVEELARTANDPRNVDAGDGRQKHPVAVVVFTHTDGVDYGDAENAAEMVIRRKIGGDQAVLHELRKGDNVHWQVLVDKIRGLGRANPIGDLLLIPADAAREWRLASEGVVQRPATGRDKAAWLKDLLRRGHHKTDDDGQWVSLDYLITEAEKAEREDGTS